ncbi:MAG: hypothetical protein N2662_06030 [Bacteroidales bacterium]|nr:hypothetical protein [Bacteroidales bacterium]
MLRYTATLGVFLIYLLPLVAQSQNEYTIGVDSKGNYGFLLNRYTQTSLFQFSYNTINLNQTFKLSQIPGGQNIFSSQVNSLSLGYYHKKNLTNSLNLYYGSSLNLGNSPFKSTLTENKYLSNVNLQIGLKYKLTENISIGAEINHSYGNFWLNNSSYFWQPSPAYSNWLTW